MPQPGRNHLNPPINLSRLCCTGDAKPINCATTPTLMPCTEPPIHYQQVLLFLRSTASLGHTEVSRKHHPHGVITFGKVSGTHMRYAHQMMSRTRYASIDCGPCIAATQPLGLHPCWLIRSEVRCAFEVPQPKAYSCRHITSIGDLRPCPTLPRSDAPGRSRSKLTASQPKRNPSRVDSTSAASWSTGRQ